jgi:CRISPR-associated endonuclease/helicase Cas3
MLYSSLVDGDFLDTEAFADQSRTHARTRHWSISKMSRNLDQYLDRLSAGSRASDTVRAARAEVLESCRTSAALEPGLFSLTVPTGGGKTLSSLSFALRHAVAHDLDRIIYVIPFTSIIEQNASVFRGVFAGDEAEDLVVEHHSNFEANGDDDWRRLAAENWDAPLIVTTNVQFFESLFSHKPSRNRKLHNIANSVVVFDEAQTLPPHVLLPTLRVLRELSATYRSTLVFCTATQPAIRTREEFPLGLPDVREIVPDPAGLAAKLRRTEVQLPTPQSEDDLVATLSSTSQVLAIVNTRRAASELFSAARASGLDDLYHLSTRMYPGHRSRVIAEVKERLASGKPARVISTQLIEAGVDIDFPLVLREIAGVDSIAQAAGRCNREGRLEDLGRVVVFEPTDRSLPRMFRANVDAAREAMNHSTDLLAPGTVEAYFRHLYWAKSYGSGLDSNEIQELLSSRRGATMHIPFREIGELYRLIPDDDSASVVVPGLTDNERAAVEEQVESLRRGGSARVALRRLQRFTVQIRTIELNDLRAAGVIDEPLPALCILNNRNAYDESLGLVCEHAARRDPNDLIC